MRVFRDGGELLWKFLEECALTLYFISVLLLHKKVTVEHNLEEG